jgi:NADH-quinone oxidoreductase subunit C
MSVDQGSFGVKGTGDTSGYGGLVRKSHNTLSSERPYGSYFDEMVDELERAYPEFNNDIERVVVDRGELTLHVKAERLFHVAQVLRDNPSLRFEMCLGVNGAHYPADKDRELHAVYPLLSLTHNRRIRLEVSLMIIQDSLAY